MLKKQEPYERRFFWLFAGVLQLARFSFETRLGTGISRLFQTRVSAAVNSLTYKFTVIDIVAKTLGQVTTSVGK